MGFKIGEIVDCIYGLNMGYQVEVLEVGPLICSDGKLVDYKCTSPGAAALGLQTGGWQYYMASSLRKRPNPTQSKEDQEARERFLKGCHEKPNFHEILSDLQPVTEEVAKRVLENMGTYYGA